MTYSLAHANPYADRLAYMDHTSLFGGLGILGVLIVLFMSMVFVALVVIGIIALVRHSRKAHAAKPAADTGVVSAENGSLPAEDSALEIARERLARGEIDPDQYKTILEALSS